MKRIIAFIISIINLDIFELLFCVNSLRVSLIYIVLMIVRHV